MNRKFESVQETITDVDAILKILQGETEMYAVIIQRYNQRLYKIAMAIINDVTEVEDAMQVAYINAYQNLGNFECKSGFSTWITRILINECLLRVKRRGRAGSITYHSETMLLNHSYREPREPDMKVINNELRFILDEAIKKLPEIYRVVFIMREVEGLSIQETKTLLNITEANVKVRLNRAKFMLKRALYAYYKKEDIFHFHEARCTLMIRTVINFIKATQQRSLNNKTTICLLKIQL